MYKIVQNYLQSNEYEYAHDYESIEEAQKMVHEYICEDIERGELHGYTILDNDGDDAEEKEREAIENMQRSALSDMGLPEDEVEMLIEDARL
jgi:hypothetical protein